MVAKKAKKRKLVKQAFDDLSFHWYDWEHE